MRHLLMNVTGALVAIGIAAFLYGEAFEEEMFPVLTPVKVSAVERDGNKIGWIADWCKVRNLELNSVSFTFNYPKQKGTIPVNVQNVTKGRSVGQTSLPKGCYSVQFSAMLPRDSMDGGVIEGQIWYNPPHPFWDLRSDFGTVTVPPLAAP